MQRAMHKFEESLLAMEIKGTARGAQRTNNSVSAFCPPPVPTLAYFSPLKTIPKFY